MWEDRAPGHLDNVVESLTGVVPQPAVGIIETRQHRLDQLLQVQPRVLGGTRRLVSSGPCHREWKQMALPWYILQILMPVMALVHICWAGFTNEF